MVSRIKNKQDISTRNDQIDHEAIDSDQIESRVGQFSRTIKDKPSSSKKPARNDSLNQTPKLLGLSKLVIVIL